MAIQLDRMEPVPIRDIWPHEEHDFTPWLAENFDYLNDALDLNLVVKGREVDIPGSGRADIVAQAGEAVVIVENQLESSDDDHFVRMMHYAARSRAKIVVWVTSGFTDKHREILGWLNEGNGVDIYCVEVSAWRIGDSVAPMFRQVVTSNWVEPHERIESRRYRTYYRPLIERLREAGMVHEPEPGWKTGVNFRWFSTAFDDAHYGLLYGDEDGQSWVFLLFNSEDPSQPIYQDLLALRSKVEQDSDQALEWEWDEDAGEAWIGVRIDAAMIDDAASQRDTQEWMYTELTGLRNALTPSLEAVAQQRND